MALAVYKTRLYFIISH